jgi:hypothetical protein
VWIELSSFDVLTEAGKKAAVPTTKKKKKRSEEQTKEIH